MLFLDHGRVLRVLRTWTPTGLAVGSAIPAFVARWVFQGNRDTLFGSHNSDTLANDLRLRLPPELWLIVANHLVLKDKVALLKSCKSLYDVLAPSLYANLVFSLYPPYYTLYEMLVCIARNIDYAACARELLASWNAPLSSRIRFFYQLISAALVLNEALSSTVTVHTLSRPESLTHLDLNLSQFRGKIQLLTIGRATRNILWFAVRRVSSLEDEALWYKESCVYRTIKAASPVKIAHGCVHSRPFGQNHPEIECLGRLFETLGNTIVTLVLDERMRIWQAELQPVCENLETIEIRAPVTGFSAVTMMIQTLVKWTLPRITTLMFFDIARMEAGSLDAIVQEVINIVKMLFPLVTRIVDPTRHVWENVDGVFTRNEHIVLL